MTTTNDNAASSANQTTSSGQEEAAASTTKKRGAERQITKDDRDEDDAEVDPNAPMIKASQEVMQQRKILKVARNADGSVDWSKKKKPNPFASVQLTTTTNKPTEKEEKTKEDKPTTTSIFGSSTTFSGFGSAAGGGGFGSSSGFGSGGFGSPSTTSLSFGNAKGFGTVNTKETSSTATEGGETAKPLFQFAAPPSSSDNNKNDKAPDADKNGQNDNDETTGASSILPTEYELQSGEEDEKVLLEVRCKTYRWGPVTTGRSATEIGEGTPSSRALAAVPPTSAATTASEKATAASPDDTPKADETETKKGDDDTDKSKNGTDTKGNDNADNDTKESSPAKEGKAASPEKDSKEDSPKTEMTWHEVGVGPLRVLKANPRSGDTDQPLVVRLVQRRQVHPSSVPTKVLLNLRLFSECSVTQPSDKHCRFSTPSGQDGSATTILFKVGKATQAQELIALLKQEMPTAPSCFGEQQASSSAKEKDGTAEAEPTKGE